MLKVLALLLLVISSVAIVGRTDRVAGQERGPERTTRFAYDAAGSVAAVTGPDGAVRRFAHDPLFDLVTAVTQPSGAVTRYGYDAEGALVTVTDATGRAWTFGRDVAGQVVEEVDFTGRRLGYGYDAAGRLVEAVDARGLVTRMARDAAGRLTERVYAVGTEAETAEAFAYDAAGRLTEASNATVAVGFAYDAVGQVVEEWQCLGDGALAGTPLAGGGAQSVRSTYDALGRRVARATPAGRDLAFGHDAEGRLTSIEDGVGPLVRTSLDKLGRTRRRAIGADVGGQPALVGLRTYTAFGELAEQRLVRDAGPGRVGLAEVFKRTYSLDVSGQITEIEDSRWAAGPSGPGPAVLAFRHDADGRLSASVYPDRGLEPYEADAAGNVPAAPVRLPQPPVSDAGAASGGDRDRVVAVRVAAGWTLGYDADGNLLTKTDALGRHGGTAWRYVYDAAGRLSEVFTDDGAGEIQVGAYGYDVLGRRVARQTWAEGGSGFDERVVWDGGIPAERQRAEREPLAVLDSDEGACS